MKHLILCREYPPAPYPAGGIGTYASHIARLLAGRGETVHLIAQAWDGAPDPITTTCEGRLNIHRIRLDRSLERAGGRDDTCLLKRLANSTCPTQVFSWQAARYAERLIEMEEIDLVEGQEWEAPLYYLQMRRRLGMGPQRRPPILVHLHSPSEMIFRFNEWDTTLTDYAPLCRFEEYSIRNADAWICPSRFLAEGVANRFGCERDEIHVVPYPMGETLKLERGAEVWRQDRITYIGRLELRKGVVEWVDAAIAVAGEHGTASFEFIGSDTLLEGGAGRSVLEHLKQRIPDALRDRFHFRGGQGREQLMTSLGSACVAVVPSRWENLPFTCIEAMATGLPVLASPHGGMTELIRDGESGWIAESGSPAGLAAALRRVLATDGAQRSAMGAHAAASIRQICGNEEVLARHMELRSRIAQEGATQAASGAAQGMFARSTPGERRMGVVIVCLERLDGLAECLNAVIRQSLMVRVALVTTNDLRERVGGLLATISGYSVARIEVVALPSASWQSACEAGVEALNGGTHVFSSIAFLEQNMVPDAGFAPACDGVLAGDAGVGAVVPWIWNVELKELEAGPAPLSSLELAEYPYVRAGVVRGEALHAICPNEGKPAPAQKSWMVITYPDVLVTVVHDERTAEKRRYSVMALIGSGSAGFALEWFLRAPWSEKLRWLTEAAAQPERITRWMRWQVRKRGGEVLPW